MLNTPLSPWPCFSEEEADAARAVILSNRVNYWTGQEGHGFEREFAAWCGARHAVALANGTLALEAALKALAIGPGDEVIVTPRTFIATASSVVNVGAIPVFADVTPDSGNISAETIRAVLSPRTRAVICVHLAGWPCDMAPIMALAEEHGFKVIEDCAQAHGARYRGRSVGTIGHVGAWSFCQDKIMTTGGEGGMVTTNDEDLWSRMWSIKDHGKSWKAVYETEHPAGFRWLHESFGSNWRMTEVQAAIGRIQLRRLPDWHARRNENMRLLWETARALPGLRAPMAPAGLDHAAYKYYAYVEPERLRHDWSRDRIVREITERSVPCYPGTCSEIYLEKAFEGTGWRPRERLPVAKRLGETSLMFLVHPTLTNDEIEKTRQALRDVMSAAAN